MNEAIAYLPGLSPVAGKDVRARFDGGQTRSFSFVDDMVEGLIRLMNAPDAVMGPINLGNPHEVSIGELAEKVIAVTGSESEIVYKPLPPDDPVRRRPDITLAKEKLGWEPKEPLEEGLMKTVAYVTRQLEAGAA